jgi:hypothetical protein
MSSKAQAGSQPQPSPSEPPEVAQVISKALLACVNAKNLQMQLVKLMREYASTDRENILVVIDYYKELRDIVDRAKELRAELLSYIMYLAGKVPLNREDFLRVFTTLNSVDFDKPESLIITILSDTFINTYINLLLSVQTVGTMPSQPIVLQIPVQPVQGGVNRP